VLGQAVTHEQIWATMQEPRCPAYVPTSYLLLLSALDSGWQVARIELAPSWDQGGSIYLVTLCHHSHKLSQQIILPKNPIVERLFFELREASDPLHHPLSGYQRALS
jgi:hypothetical protein